MSILVTGGTGAMGSSVIRRLVEKELNPICFDLIPPTKLLNDIQNKFVFVQGDTRDLPLLLRTMKLHSVDKVVHMAALIKDSESNPPLALEVNVGGTVNVLEASRLMDLKRVVYFSSKGVYGTIAGEHSHPIYMPIDENYPKNPTGIYGISKLTSEQFGCHYADKYGVSFVALRFAQTFGLGKTTAKHGTYVLPGSILENALEQRETHVEVGGDSKEDLIYHKDVAKAVDLAISANQIKSRAFNIGMGKAFSLHDVAKIVERLVPGARIEIGSGTDYKFGGKMPNAGYCVFDTTLAREELGFSPDFTLDSAFEDYLSELRRFM